MFLVGSHVFLLGMSFLFFWLHLRRLGFLRVTGGIMYLIDFPNCYKISLLVRPLTKLQV